MRILLVEDDTSIAAAIAATLRGQAHAVDQVMDGALGPIIESAITADEEARLAALSGE